jgi:hypothetical protein
MARSLYPGSAAPRRNQVSWNRPTTVSKPNQKERGEMVKSETATTLRESRIDVKIKLAALWVAVMFLFIYVDHFALFIPGVLEEMMMGKMGPLAVTQGSLVSAMVLMTIPSLMIVLSLVLKAKANRWTNIVVGILYILVLIGNTVGESWVFYILGSIVEAVLLALIVWYAFKWPKQGG